MIDVKEIHDIPEIENFLGETFEFRCYIKGDNEQVYHHYITDDVCIELCIISDEESFFHKEKLEDLITQKNIGFLSFKHYLLDSMLHGHWFRPCVEESEKEYQTN